MGLNEEFNVVRTQILSSSPLPTLNTAYHLVSQDEQQRQIDNARNTNSESSAFQAAGQYNPHQYGKTGPQLKAKQDNRNKTVKNEDRWCTHCQKSGHVIDGCFEIIGYPKWWNTKTTNLKNQTEKKGRKLRLLLLQKILVTKQSQRKSTLTL